jgi:5-methylcytosine-specific restriction enzyme A
MAIRAAFLSAHPLCVICLAKGRVAPATELDHIIALMHGGTEQDNYQALCRDCHQDKSAKDKGNRVKAEIGLDGWPL